MAPDLPEKLLGIDINDDDRPQRGSDDDDPDEEYIRVVLFRVGDHRLAVPVDDVRTTTDAPEEITPVPRTPESVEGVTDLRGEITAVIDPSVHFPSADDERTAGDDDEDTGIATIDRDQLLVFDRPGDEQSAAIRVDDINRVASIAESDVLDGDAAAARDLSTDALEHPLVSALVVEEHRPRQRLGQTVVSPESTDENATTEDETEGTEFDLESASAGSAIGAAAGTPLQTGDGESVSAPGSESSGATESVAEPEQQSKTIVEVTPLVDTSRLLLAAGPRRRMQ